MTERLTHRVRLVSVVHSDEARRLYHLAIEMMIFHERSTAASSSFASFLLSAQKEKKEYRYRYGKVR